MYYYNDENGKIKISYEPKLASESRIRHYLMADDGKVLKHTQSNEITSAVIVPEWEIQDWEEMDI